MSTRFQHTPLDNPSKQIRLLRLAPFVGTQDTEGNSIHCTLVCHEIECAPDYVAVSYTWGKSHSLRTIQINQQPLEVTENCWYVLCQMDIHRVTSPVWIDALCIDQQNVEEKSVQVALMGSIYSNAATVKMCIGRHRPNSSEHLFTRMAEHTETLGIVDEDDEAFALNNTYKPRIGISDHAEEILRRLGVLEWFVSLHDEAITLARALGHLLRRSYFRRLWIVQEVFLARSATVLCGGSSISLASIHTFSQNLARFSTLTDLGLYGENLQRYSTYLSMSTVTRFGVAKQKVRLDQAHQTMSAFSCYDNRDKIFGLLHVLDWCGVTPVQTDYSKTAFEIVLEILRSVCSNILSPESTETDVLGSIGFLMSWLGLTTASHPIDAMLRCRRLDHDMSPSLGTPMLSMPIFRIAMRPETFVSLLRSNAADTLLAPDLELQQADGSADAALPTPSGRFNHVVNGQQHLGYVPSSTRAGDTLAWFGLTYERTALILRREAGNSSILRIIGQAIFERDLDCRGETRGSIDRGVPSAAYHVDGSGVRVPIEEVDITVHFDPVDYMLWHCQSFSDARGFQEFRPKSSETLLSRLVTSVCDPENPFSSFAVVEG